MLEELHRIRSNPIVKCFSLRDDYLFAISGTQKHLVKRTAINKYVFIAELVGANKEIRPKMVSIDGNRNHTNNRLLLIAVFISQDHLTCYLGGTLALGVHHGLSADHMDLANEIVKTCYQTYAIQPTFLAPEITYFNIQVIIGTINASDKNSRRTTSWRMYDPL